MRKIHFLVEVNLTGGTPLVEWVEHLGLPGIAAEPVVMEGWTSPVELIGRFTCPNGIALLVKGSGTRLLNGKAGSSGCENFEVKGS